MQSERLTHHEDEIDLRELMRTVSKHKGKLSLFLLLAVVLSVGWGLSKPNMYRSQAVMIPQEQSKTSSLGGLGALAGMAGVDIGGGEMSADQGYQLYLDDYSWMREFLVASGLFERLISTDIDKNYHFALGYDGFYRMFKVSEERSLKELTPQEREKMLFNAYLSFKGKLTISSDKKTSLITVAYHDPDAILARDAVKLFLTYASESLRKSELSDIDKKIRYYEEELQKNSDLALKTQLSQLMSGLIQKKVLAYSSELYNVKMITAPSIAYERDKEGPKRGFIVVVTMLASLVVGIFGIFLLEFFRRDDKAAV